MMHRSKISAYVAGILLALLTSGCEHHGTCRPGSVFVTLPMGTVPDETIELLVTVTLHSSGAVLNASTPYHGGTTLEIVLPRGGYVAGSEVELVVAAAAGDVALVTFFDTIAILPPTCTAVTMHLPGENILDLLGLSGSDLPDLSVETPADLVPPDDLAKKSLGEVCATGDDCTKGFCIDGFCCNAACDGQCEACDVATLEGFCAPVAGPPHGARAACGGVDSCVGMCSGSVRTACAFPQPSTSCRAQSCSGSTKTKAAGCDGLGNCAPLDTAICSQGCSGDDCLGACTGDGECAAASASTPYCDSGTCTAAKPLGRACSATTECTSGICVDGVCCNVACDQQCDSCVTSGAVGTCARVTGAPLAPRAACSGTDVCVGACDGTAPSCVAPGASTSCGAVSCASGMLTSIGGCAAGSCAQTTTPCPNGNCASGTACGSCTADGQCGAGRWCNGGTCTATGANGAGCSAPDQCASGNCETNLAGNAKVCCASACGGTGTTPVCNGAFTGCACQPGTCGSNSVCNPTTNTCCSCVAGTCRDFATCGGACGLTCSRCCGCGAGSMQCCSGLCP